MSMSGAISGAALLLLLLPLTTAHEQYSTLGDLLHWYAHSAQTHPSLVRYTELKEPEYEHVILPLATFANNVADEGRTREKPSAILVFGEHARELITCEVGLWFSRVLLGDTAEIFRWEEWPRAFDSLGIAPDKIQATVEGWVRRILENLVVKVLPVENVDGRQAWEAGNLCLRKTSKGVDLNRNYPFAFATEPPHSEMFGGPHPFSEAQSRLIARIALDGGRVPKAYINVHSGEWAVYSGWDSKAAVGPGLPEDLSDLLIRSGDVCRCQAGPAGAVSNYLAFGTGMDFMYTQLGVPYSLTYEVYGSGSPFGGGEPGRIPDGVHNKPLSEYPYVVDDKIARSVPRVEDLFPPPQHHQRTRDVVHHHQRRYRAARAHAARLRRSAGFMADEETREGAGAGGVRRQLAMEEAGAAFARWDDSVGVGQGGGALRDGADAAGRRLFEEASAASSAVDTGSASVVASQAAAGAAEVFSLPLGGRSMRHLAAAAAGGHDGVGAATLSSAAGGAEEVEAASAAAGGGVGTSGGSSRALQADVSAFSGPDGPILAMVRSQPGMHQGCFDMFNPRPGSAYRDVVSRWVVILLMTLDHVADPAHPKPSPHPLPGTVLAGAGAGGEAWGGATAFGRRRLLEASGAELQAETEAGAEAALSETLVGGEHGRMDRVGQRVVNVADSEADAAVRGGVADASAAVGEGVSRQAGDLYGSADFDRRMQQRQYEVDPVMRRHSLVVFAALCCLGVVFVPWFLCVNKQVTRSVPPASWRGRVALSPGFKLPPPPSRAYI